MAVKLNLLAEEPAFQEQLEYIIEESNRNAPATMYIKGPFMGAELVNKNKRLYPIEEMRKEVGRYCEEMIKPGRAMGELNHPASADVDLERACHLVTELSEKDNVFYGKSKVLTTPTGLIVKALINDGVKVGMSSRALGTLEESRGHNVVRNMRLVAIDCVADPSFGDAWVNGIMESKKWIVNSDGKYEEYFDKFKKSLSKLPKHDVDVYLREQIINFIRSL